MYVSYCFCLYVDYLHPSSDPVYIVLDPSINKALKLLSKMLNSYTVCLVGLRSVLVATNLDQTVGLRFGFNLLPRGYRSWNILIRPNICQGLSWVFALIQVFSRALICIASACKWNYRYLRKKSKNNHTSVGLVYVIVIYHGLSACTWR